MCLRVCNPSFIEEIQLISGKVATSAGWSEPRQRTQVTIIKSGLPPGPGGPKGRGRGGGALGDLFSGGFKPNPGMLKPGGGRGRGMVR